MAVSFRVNVCCLCLFAVLFAISPTLLAREAAQPEGIAANAVAPEAASGFRQLAPGVMRTVPPNTEHDESYSRHDIVGLLSKAPNFGERPWSPSNMAKDVRMEHDVWALEFSYKPMRFIDVEIADASGRSQRKTVWYLVYRVTNRTDKPIKWVPRFLLHAQEARPAEGEPATGSYYPDRILANAVPAIQRREDPRRKLLNCVEMASEEILPSTEEEDNSVWGVATWRDIDPKTDLLSVYVQGLTNAYEIKVGEDGKWERFLRKTLQLNFWRPSDEFYAHEREIRVGIPGEVDYRWVYK